MAEPIRPKFRVIEGGGTKPSSWLLPPSTVLGKSPFDNRGVMAYRVASGDLQKTPEAMAAASPFLTYGGTSMANCRLFRESTVTLTSQNRMRSGFILPTRVFA